MPINNGIINQKGTPAFYSDIFANRPAFGYAGRVFISTDTGAIYEDTGTAWTLIADAGAGTTGTLQQVTTNGNTTTLGIVVQGININDGAGSGASNIAIGTNSLRINTTGYINVALGYSALEYNTTGFANIGIGQQTLLNNTTGNANVGVGNAVLSGNVSGSNNTAIGNGALSTSGTASNNTAVGYQSLAANTTGTLNTAIGKSSMEFNTTGIQNTALGAGSLNGVQSGSYNTAIGSGALALNNIASNNTAIGNASLAANTGANNTAVGSGTLQSNTTGVNNVAMGYLSLNANTTGAGNTAIGNASLAANTTGNNNVAIGYTTFTANTTGVGNTAIGNSALNVNSTASYNTAIGFQSLVLNTTGTQNTAIGVTAGNLITTGSNNTIIGNYGGTPTLANNIVLSDGAGNVRLFSDANGLIGINQAVGSTIGGQLDIHTTQTYALVLNGLTTSNAYTAFSNNSVGKWRIGNTYNAGANSFDIFNLTSSSSAMSILSTNFVYFGALPSVLTYVKYNFNVGANQNIGFRSSGGLATIEAVNDGVSANIPIQFAGSQYVYGGGNITMGSAVDDTINKLQVTGSGTFSTKVSVKGGSGFGGYYMNYQSDITSRSFRVTSEHLVFGDFVIQRSTTQTGTTYEDLIYFDVNRAAKLPNLAGTGSRAVLADANGVLSAPVSDISVKENINTIGYGLNEILKMNPVWFDYNDEYKNYGEGRQNGNIAQEMEAIIPEAVFTTPSTGKMGINYDQLHAVYIKAIQELKAEIDALKNN
jgi:hypothetical protein